MARKSIQVRSNFSFIKLLNEIEDIIEDFTFDEARGYAAEAKKPIAEGTLPVLSNNTILKRQVGYSDYQKFGHSPKPTPDERPFFYTGDLHDSIKAVKGAGVMLNKYGLEHNDGIGELKREFLPKAMSSKLRPYREKALKSFVIKLNKALMK